LRYSCARSHGSGMYLLERREFLSILCDGLPDKSPIKTSSGVRRIKQLAGGVEVTLSNSDVECGDIVIGCDGVYSTVRSFMWDHANKTISDFITVKEKTCKLYSYPETLHKFRADSVSIQNSMEILN
jgi:2-polyprenyl-6-methoxyphenol hydroxylase-like FAD-dependent oxidoreductase